MFRIFFLLVLCNFSLNAFAYKIGPTAVNIKDRNKLYLECVKEENKACIEATYILQVKKEKYDLLQNNHLDACFIDFSDYILPLLYNKALANGGAFHRSNNYSDDDDNGCGTFLFSSIGMLIDIFALPVDLYQTKHRDLKYKNFLSLKNEKKIVSLKNRHFSRLVNSISDDLNTFTKAYCNKSISNF